MENSNPIENNEFKFNKPLNEVLNEPLKEKPKRKYNKKPKKDEKVVIPLSEEPLLEESGYSTKLSEKERHDALDKAVEKNGYKKIALRLNAMSIRFKNNNPELSELIKSDHLYIKEKHQKVKKPKEIIEVKEEKKEDKIKVIGSRAEVFHGKAKKTSGGLIKEDLMKNKHGLIVSKKKHEQGLLKVDQLKPYQKTGEELAKLRNGE